MTSLIIAGEISGDLYASYLAKEIKKEDPDHIIYAIGGTHLKSSTDHFIFESASKHGVSLAKHFFNFKFKKALLLHLKNTLVKTPIKQAILVDFQHLNEPIARLLQAFSIPIHTFITPNFWMWQSKRPAKKICDYSEKIFCIFQPEYMFYKSMHKQTFYYGHPFSDIIPDNDIANIASSSEPKITLLPGSRPQEFALYLPKMLQTCSLLLNAFPLATFYLVVSSKEFETKIQNYLSDYKDLNIQLVFNSSHNSIKNSHLVLSASGSATLEVILLNRPLIVFAALPCLTYFIAKYILKIKLSFISLPNFLTQQAIIPEFVQSKIIPAQITKTAISMLKNPKVYTKKYSIIKKCLINQKNVYCCIVKEINS